MHGTEDRFTPLALSKEFAAKIVSPDSTLHVSDGGFHELLNDSCAQEVLLVLTSWIEQRLSTQ
jgi:alpha-beta hydrolase superfamily lysophospholipase